ncbi:cyclase family protein [Pelodictyon luteolum]|uniref:Kynurenine formamidase n=1 Tax=Chlorobium luteolum (strain DSM 273 / BCRC 81028 / 2530) TaxID=319225 RepID=Q3B156_CHLL3|nr:cyclase family protein [Pelodictyon luteolum]ABB24925.1 Kynurenine formamidase [Pelodictyon luteolum DSM 273]
MRIHDLSHSIAEGMPLWPASPVTRVRDAAGYGTEGYLEREYSFSSHAGTHVDLPLHMLPEGRSLDACPLEAFAGRGFVLDAAPENGGVVTATVIAAGAPPEGSCDFLLIHTGWSSRWGSPSYFEACPYLQEEAALLLVSKGLKGIGIDSPSIDPPLGDAYPSHRILLGHGLVVVENLTGLFPLIGKRFLFSAFPLKIAGAEASPVRAAAIEEEEGAV